MIMHSRILNPSVLIAILSYNLPEYLKKTISKCDWAGRHIKPTLINLDTALKEYEEEGEKKKWKKAKYRKRQSHFSFPS